MISIIRSKQLRIRFAVALALTAAILLPLVANAQKYEVDMKNSCAAVVIEQPQPGHPGGSVRKGQEGWVKMSFVVIADGRAIDPIIIDSSGGAGFEREAREAVSTWHFEARCEIRRVSDDVEEGKPAGQTAVAANNYRDD